MAREIPAPARPKARPAQSWSKLKVGQQLAVRPGQSVYTPALGRCPAGTYFTVADVNSLGALLEENYSKLTLEWTDREWPRTFERVKKTRKKKAPKEKTSG